MLPRRFGFRRASGSNIQGVSKKGHPNFYDRYLKVKTPSKLLEPISQNNNFKSFFFLQFQIWFINNSPKRPLNF